MENGIPTPLERRCPILLVCDAEGHLIDRMLAGRITPRECRDALELFSALWLGVN